VRLRRIACAPRCGPGATRPNVPELHGIRQANSETVRERIPSPESKSPQTLSAPVVCVKLCRPWDLASLAGIDPSREPGASSISLASFSGRLLHADLAKDSVLLCGSCRECPVPLRSLILPSAILRLTGARPGAYVQERCSANASRQTHSEGRGDVPGADGMIVARVDIEPISGPNRHAVLDVTLMCTPTPRRAGSRWCRASARSPVAGRPAGGSPGSSPQPRDRSSRAVSRASRTVTAVDTQRCAGYPECYGEAIGRPGAPHPEGTRYPAIRGSTFPG
jgi:hypothetical protein